MHIAAAIDIQFKLLPAIKKMAEKLEQQAADWDKIVKIGRTTCRDDDADPPRPGVLGLRLAVAPRRGTPAARSTRLSELPLAAPPSARASTPRSSANSSPRNSRARPASTSARPPNHFEASTPGRLRRDLRPPPHDRGQPQQDRQRHPLAGLGPALDRRTRPPRRAARLVDHARQVNPSSAGGHRWRPARVIGNDHAVAAHGGLGGVGSLLDLNVAMPMMAANVLDSAPAHAFVPRLHRQPARGLKSPTKRGAGPDRGLLAMCTSLVP